MVRFEKEREIEFEGIVKQITQPKPFGRNKRVGIKINDQWYSLVGSITTFNKMLENIEVGTEVIGKAVEKKWTNSEGEEKIDYRIIQIKKKSEVEEKKTSGKDPTFQQLLSEIKGLRKDIQSFLSKITSSSE